MSPQLFESMCDTPHYTPAVWPLANDTVLSKEWALAQLVGYNDTKFYGVFYRTFQVGVIVGENQVRLHNSRFVIFAEQLASFGLSLC